jgi:Mg/Co/Ni transporter MgtE
VCYAHETVTACIEQISQQTDNVDVMYAVYVVDEKERLIGMLSLKKIGDFPSFGSNTRYF